MKKLILFLAFLIFLAPTCFASDNYIAFSENSKFSTKQSITREIKNTLRKHIEYSNSYNIEALRELYSSNYMNSDGFTKEIYFDLIKQTWDLYPDIQYDMEIKDIMISGNTAVVETQEKATATSTEDFENKKIKGSLNSNSSSIYYLEKIGAIWKVVSDNVITEKTTLTYGEASTIGIELVAPQQVPANKDYTASLNLTVPDKNMLVIASIGQEKITHPQVNSEEVFRKLPEDGILERVFKSNKDNLNEYTVASIGITRASMTQNKEIRISVTGLGYVITRTNIIPIKNFEKVKDGKQKAKSDK